MQHVALAAAADFAGWREAARNLSATGVHPDTVEWSVGAQLPGLFAEAELAGGHAEPAVESAFNVPRSFLALGALVVRHSDPERFALLYRLLWRLRSEPRLMQLSVDADVARAAAMARAVQRDQHKMKAFVRFREIRLDHEPRYLAWFEPEHHIVEATAPFFVRRFANRQWSILTPEISAHWDDAKLYFTPGATRADAAGEDGLEDLWRTYYASIFKIPI